MLLSELPCCAQGQLKLKNEHGNDIFDGERFLCSRATGGCIDQGRRTKNARVNFPYFVLI